MSCNKQILQKVQASLERWRQARTVKENREWSPSENIPREYPYLSFDDHDLKIMLLKKMPIENEDLPLIESAAAKCTAHRESLLNESLTTADGDRIRIDELITFKHGLNHVFHHRPKIVQII